MVSQSRCSPKKGIVIVIQSSIHDITLLLSNNLVTAKKFKLRYAPKNTLCTLVQVNHADPSNTTEIIITNDSPGSDFIISPVARSYQNSTWEKVQGPYVRKFKIFKCRTKRRNCTVRLKRLGIYFLMSYQHQIGSFDERVSRFFSQATFGPTRDMIANWPYGRNQKGMAQWIKDQTLLPPTKHREYFRSKIDLVSNNNEIKSTSTATQHPCDPYSRWSKNTFLIHDVQKFFEVIEFGNQYLIIIDGVARSLVDNFESEPRHGTFLSGPGSYRICKYKCNFVLFVK